MGQSETLRAGMSRTGTIEAVTGLMGDHVEGLGFRVQGSGFRVWAVSI